MAPLKSPGSVPIWRSYPSAKEVGRPSTMSRQGTKFLPDQNFGCLAVNRVPVHSVLARTLTPLNIDHCRSLGLINSEWGIPAWDSFGTAHVAWATSSGTGGTGA